MSFSPCRTRTMSRSPSRSFTRWAPRDWTVTSLLAFFMLESRTSAYVFASGMTSGSGMAEEIWKNTMRSGRAKAMIESGIAFWRLTFCQGGPGWRKVKWRVSSR